MAKILVNLRLEKRMLDAIDRLAGKEGITRTEVMERALDRGLGDEEAFVRSLEKPISRVVMKALAASGVVEAIFKSLGVEADSVRVDVSKRGVKGKQRAVRNDEGIETA